MFYGRSVNCIFLGAVSRKVKCILLEGFLTEIEFFPMVSAGCIETLMKYWRKLSKFCRLSPFGALLSHDSRAMFDLGGE